MRPLPRPKFSSAGNSIDIVRYAEIAAHLRHFPADKKDEVIARLGVRRHDWETASARWSNDLTTSADEGRTDLIKRYSTAFSRARVRLATLRPSIESLGPLPGPDGAEPAAAPVSPGNVIPIDAPPLFSSTSSDPSARIAAPSYLVAESLPGRSPWAIAEQLAVPAPAPMPAVLVSPPVPPCVPVPIHRAPAEQEVTMTLQVSLPFPAQRLPFDPQQAAPEEAFDNAVAHAEAIQGPAARPSVSLASTVGVSAPARGPALPFTSSKSSPGISRPIPNYTLEQYASLRVELHTYPDRADETLARYHLDAEAGEALEEHWNGRFEADPSLRSAFLSACARYKAWLATRDGK